MKFPGEKKSRLRQLEESERDIVGRSGQREHEVRRAQLVASALTSEALQQAWALPGLSVEETAMFRLIPAAGLVPHVFLTWSFDRTVAEPALTAAAALETLEDLDLVASLGAGEDRQWLLTPLGRRLAYAHPVDVAR